MTTPQWLRQTRTNPPTYLEAFTTTGGDFRGRAYVVEARKQLTNTSSRVAYLVDSMQAVLPEEKGFATNSVHAFKYWEIRKHPRPIRLCGSWAMEGRREMLQYPT
jgi:hypothetical protein